MSSLLGSVSVSPEEKHPYGRQSKQPHVHVKGHSWDYIWLSVRFLLVLCILLALGSVGLVYTFYEFTAERIYPNVTIRGVDVGQMTREEASAALRLHYAPFLNKPVMLVYQDHIWQPTLAELGARLEIDEAIEQAFATARHGENWLEHLRTVGAVWEQGIELPVHLVIDQQKMQYALQQHAQSVEKLATDARLLLHDDGQSELINSLSGRQMLAYETVQDITVALQTLQSQAVAVRTQELPPLLDDTTALEAQKQIETLLQGPLILKGQDNVWEWSPSELAQMIQIRRSDSTDGSGDHFVVSIDSEQIRQRLPAIADATRQLWGSPTVNWNGGEPIVIHPGTPGVQLDLERAEAMILDAMWTPERVVNLPLREYPAPSTTEEFRQMGIVELLSQGKTDFTRSAHYRITNIIAGMNLLHGRLIAPGEEFSFNRAIGSIGPENGFVKGEAIVDGEIEIEWGGGICQDSTTMYRAAFWAGLPITERWNHSHYIRWYDVYGYGNYGHGPGIDSTIFLAPGGPDLKFVNDTGQWILIQASVHVPSALAEIRLYGTKGARTVEFEGPSIQHIGENMQVYFTRIIKQDGVEVDRSTFSSLFEPWE